MIVARRTLTDWASSWTSGQRPIEKRGLLLAGALALLGRLTCVECSIGTNDMTTWRTFARDVSKHGLGWMYDNVELFNHPALMGLFSAGAYELSERSGVP